MPEVLLRYPLALWAEGTLALSLPWLPGLALVAAAAAGGAWLALRGQAPVLGARGRWLAGALRGTLLALLVLLLLRPVLVVSTPEATRGGLVMLLDGSLSMTLTDGDEASRAEQVAARLHPATGDVTGSLAARFELDWHVYGGGLEPLAEGEWPAFDAPRSDLAGALQAVAAGPARARPTAVVLVSDGGDEGGALEAAVLALRARGLPVHVLAAGAQQAGPDAELSALSAPRRVLAGDSLALELEVAARGLAGEPARLAIEVDGTRRLQRDVELPADDVLLRVPLALDLRAPGLVRIEASLAPVEGETVTANNTASSLVEVLSAAPPVLHYEAEPRFEVKFLRRALAEDAVLELTSVVRTADNKYYRLGMASDEQIADGFPAEAAALFRYGVVVLGLSRVATLGAARLALLEEFVARRGGGLVLLGGPRDGQRVPAVIARLSPLDLPAGEVPVPVPVRVRAEPGAAAHPVTRFLLGEEAATPLEELPALTVALPSPAAKPGAEVLLGGETFGREPLVVWAGQRYGRGRVVALPVRDTWRWQMHADVGPDDPTHETFWRQQLRWLARQVPARVEMRTRPAVPVPGTPVRLRVEVRDPAWEPHASEPPTLIVTTPLGERLAPPLLPVAGEPGVYEASFLPGEAGAWELRVADPQDEALQAERWLQVVDEGREFLAPRLHEPVLRRVAEATGGSYRPLARAGDLADAIEPVAAGAEVTRRLPLWDLPLAYLLALALVLAEWTLRRRRRLP